MSKIFLIWILFLLTWNNSAAQEVAPPVVRVNPDSADSLSYQLIITNIYFDQWYLLNFDPVKDRTDAYYRSKNIPAAQYWNDYFRTGRYREVIDTWLNYEPNVDYGIELNRKLYWFFRFVSTEYKINLSI